MDSAYDCFTRSTQTRGHWSHWRDCLKHTTHGYTKNVQYITYIYIHRLLSWSMVYTCNLMILCMVWSYVCHYYNMNNLVESEGLHVYPSMHLAHVRQWKEDCTGCAQVWLISLTLEMIISVGGHIHHFLCHIQNTWIKYVDHIIFKKLVLIWSYQHFWCAR
jgi:hypothetical protein